MDIRSVVTVRLTDDEAASPPRAALVSPLLVLVAGEPAEAIVRASRLAVTVTSPDGRVERPAVRSVDVRPSGATGTALVGLTLAAPVAAPPDEVAGVGAGTEGEASALLAAAWAHLRPGEELPPAFGRLEPGPAPGDGGDERLLPGLGDPGGPDDGTPWCRWLHLGCARRS